MEAEKIMTPEESLRIIDQMIQKAKNNIVKEDGLMYLVWGWLVFIAAILQYILIKMDNELNYLGWAILMPLGAIISMVLGFKKKKTIKVKTHVDQVLGYMWISFGITLGIVLFSSGKLGFESTYPIVISIYGIGTFVSGGALKFKPLIVGGIFCWILSIAAFQVTFQNQLLLLATSVLVSYIIPGYILKMKYSNDNI